MLDATLYKPRSRSPYRGFGDPAPADVTARPITPQEAIGLQAAYGQLQASVEASSSDIDSALAAARAQSWIVPFWSGLTDQTNIIRKQQADAALNLASIGGVVNDIVSRNMILNPTTQVSRVATAGEAAALLRAMSNCAQQYAAIADAAYQSEFFVASKNVLKGSVERLAQQAADFGDAAAAILKGVEALLDGLGKGGEAIGWLMPAIVIGVTGVGLYLLYGIAQRKASRY
jgi:hypothetical protein